jgi:hypothetical protein
MKMRVVFFLLTAMWSGESVAQSFLSLQWEVAEPTESFANAANTGFGVKGTYHHFISRYVALTGSAGYVKWESRVATPPSNDYRFISVPVHLGMDFLLSKGIVAPYAGISLGMNYLRVRGIAPNSTTGIYADNSELKFGFSPHIGTAIFLAGPLGVNITGAYNLIYTSGSPTKYFSLNAGLAVGF